MPIFDNYRKKFHVIHKRKFSNLNVDFVYNNNSVDNNNNNDISDLWFKNLTDTGIPKDVINVVALGSKYNVKSQLNENSVIEIIKNVESLFDRYNTRNIVTFDEVQVEYIRATVLNNINFNLKRSGHVSINEKIFQNKLKLTLNFLRHNKNIFFTMADKGKSNISGKNPIICIKLSYYYLIVLLILN